MRPGIKTGGVLLVAVAGGAALAIHLASASAPPAPVAPAPVPVVTAPVQVQDVPIVVTGLGTVQALNTAVIHSQVTGLLQTVDFVEGQTVKRGDRLAQVDPR